jgi:hypothetical protein
VGAPEPAVGDDLVEMVHQHRLGQRGQIAQRYVAADGIRAQDPAVVRRVRDGMPQQALQPAALVGRQLFGRPVGAGDQLAAKASGTPRCAPHLVSGVAIHYCMDLTIQ